MIKPLLFSSLLLSLCSVAAQTTTIIDNNTYTVDTLQHSKVGPGAYYTAIKFTGPTLTFRTFYLEADANQPNFEIRTELGRDSIIGTENISAHAERKTTETECYFAAVNGDFFETTGDVGTPINGSMHNGVPATAVTGSPHFIITGGTSPYASFLTASYTYKVNGGESISLNRINGRIGTNELTVFNSTTGKYTHTPAGTAEIAIELLPGESWKINAPFKAKVVGTASTNGNHQIAEGQGVLSASGTMAHYVTDLKEGDELEFTFTNTLNNYGGIAPDIRQMVGGNTIFLIDGQTVEQGDFSRHPRTMLGYNKDRSKVIFAVVDGRSAISSGATYYELADIMKWANADYGINIDGGGSSSLYLQKFGYMNQPSDGHERAVANGVYCVSKTPKDNNITEIRFKDWAMECPKYGIYTPVFYGYNQYGILIDTDVQDVTISCNPKLGEIINEGKTFYATGEGTYALTATYNGMTASIPVTVSETDSENVSLRLSNVLIDNKREYPVEVNALVKEDLMPLNPVALSWASADTDIAEISESGVLKGVANGNTTVTGSVGDFTGTMNVTVEIPEADHMPVIEDFIADDFRLSQVGGTGITASDMDNGFKFNYTGNGSSRGANITLNFNALAVWSLPDEFRILINPGNASVKKVSMTATNALGEKGTAWTGYEADEMPKNQITEIIMSPKDWCDTEDIGIYPITLNTLRIDLGASAKGEEFEIQIPAFEACYTKQGGITNAVAENQTVKVYPNPVKAGESVSIAVEGQATVSIYSLNGAKVAELNCNGEASIPTDGMNGMYIIKVTSDNSVKIAKLMVR